MDLSVFKYFLLMLLTCNNLNIDTNINSISTHMINMSLLPQELIDLQKDTHVYYTHIL